MLQMLRHLFKATNSTSNSAEGGTSLTAFFYFGSLLSESELNKKGDAVTLSASGFSHSFYFFFSLVLQEGSRMISRCCCLLWLNIQTKKSVCDSACVLLWGWSFLSRLPESFNCSPPRKCTAARGLTGEARRHNAHSSLRG